MRRDLTKVPWEERPLAMRVYEQFMGQPMEEILRILYHKHRDLYIISKQLHLENTTLRVWFRSLSLWLCFRCSRKTGKLFDRTYNCVGCRYYFCIDCLGMEPPEHWVGGTDE